MADYQVPSLAIICLPKIFSGQTEISQRNAIGSWKRVFPDAEILLVGDDQGVAEAAADLGVRHLPDVRRNQHGTPLLDGVFEAGQAAARSRWVAYINADIILTSSFRRGFEKAAQRRCLIVGRRWDLDVAVPLAFEDDAWEEQLLRDVRRSGHLHGPTGIDYFIFPRDYAHRMPRFAVGRPAWDNWFIFRAKEVGMPVVDGTEAMTVVNQNHGYAHHSRGYRGAYFGPEARHNLELAGGWVRCLNIEQADVLLSENGWKKPPLTVSRMWREIGAQCVLGRLPKPVASGLMLLYRLEATYIEWRRASIYRGSGLGSGLLRDSSANRQSRNPVAGAASASAGPKRQ